MLTSSASICKFISEFLIAYTEDFESHNILLVPSVTNEADMTFDMY